MTWVFRLNALVSQMLGALKIHPKLPQRLPEATLASLFGSPGWPRVAFGEALGLSLGYRAFE